jgi:hypothetical protein
MIKIKNKEKKDLTLLFGLAWELSPFVKVPSSTIFSLADKDYSRRFTCFIVLGLILSRRIILQLEILKRE